MPNTEYQVRIEIQESRSGVPLKVGNRLYRTVWVQGLTIDKPLDVVNAAKNTMTYNTDWDLHGSKST